MPLWRLKPLQSIKRYVRNPLDDLRRGHRATMRRDPVSLFVGFEFSRIATKSPHSSLQSATSMQLAEQTDRADLDSIAGGSAFSFGHLSPSS